MVGSDDIRNRIFEAWQLNDGIVHDGFDFEFGKALHRGGCRWIPTSVDPTGPVRFGMVLKSVERPVQGSDKWLVDVYLGLLSKDFQNGVWDVNPYVTMPMIFDKGGQLTDAWDLQIWDNSTLEQGFDLPVIPAFPFLPPQVNTMITLYSLTVLLGNWLLGKFSSDTDASRLSLGPLAGLVMSQTVYGVRAAFAGSSPTPIKPVWRAYDAAIGGWDKAGGWPAKKGSAYEFSGEGGVQVRMWRPVVFVDDTTWSVHTKFDRLRTAAKDDHVIVTAFGRRDRDSRLLVTVTATGDLFSEGGTFNLAVDADSRDDDVFTRWSESLIVKMDASTTSKNFARTIIGAMNPLLKAVSRAEPG